MLLEILLLFVMVSGILYIEQKRHSKKVPKYCLATVGLLTVLGEWMLRERGGTGVQYVLQFLLVSICISIIHIDGIWLRIPNYCTIYMASIVILHHSLVNTLVSVDSIAGSLLISLPMLIYNRYRQESFGGGDIKLWMVVGYLLGTRTVVASFCIAIWTASFHGILGYFLRRRNVIPFGPYIVLGTIIGFFYNNEIQYFYSCIF